PEVRRIAARSRSAFRTEHPYRLVLVPEQDRTDCAKLVATARGLCNQLAEKTFAASPHGVYAGRGAASGKLAMLFPGEGSQSVGMLRDLACTFPMMQQALAEADAGFADEPRLSDFIYPQPVFRDDERARQEESLRATQVAQPALGAVSSGALQ